MEPTTITQSALDRLLDPLSRSLSPEAARSIVGLAIEPEILDRIDELAERCNEGLLTEAERAEYAGYVEGAEILALIKLKARRSLRRCTKPPPEPGPMAIDEPTRRHVRARADDRYEYCRFPQAYAETRHHVEHIVARQHGAGPGRQLQSRQAGLPALQPP